MFKNLLYIAILTTAIVFSWIYFSIYHNSTTSTISADTSIRIIPIVPQFDRETIESIKLKKIIKADLNETKAPPITPTLSSTPISTPSGLNL